jgi:glycosyltransferase involved in cell wall biosynthesis
VRQDPASKLRRLLDPRPRIVTEYRSEQLRALIEAEVRERPPDLIHCEQLHTAPYARCHFHHTAPRRVLVEQNIEYLLLRQIALARPRLTSRIAGLLDAVKTRRVEERAWRSFDACAVVSARDRDIVARAVPTARIRVLPNGVDTTHFAPQEPQSGPQGHTLVLTGTVGYYPNLHGILWFLREVFPRVRAACPDASLQIVGQASEEARHQIGQIEGVVLTGRVPDVRPYVAAGAVFIVPLHIGGGTRLKVLEAMAQGKAIVSTPVGCEGLDVVDGQHLLVAATPHAFASAIVRLLADPALRARLGASARRLAVERYDWGSIAGELEQFYQELVCR